MPTTDETTQEIKNEAPSPLTRSAMRVGIIFLYSGTYIFAVSNLAGVAKSANSSDPVDVLKKLSLILGASLAPGFMYLGGMMVLMGKIEKKGGIRLCFSKIQARKILCCKAKPNWKSCLKTSTVGVLAVFSTFLDATNAKTGVEAITGKTAGIIFGIGNGTVETILPFFTMGRLIDSLSTDVKILVVGTKYTQANPSELSDTNTEQAVERNFPIRLRIVAGCRITTTIGLSYLSAWIFSRGFSANQVVSHYERELARFNLTLDSLNFPLPQNETIAIEPFNPYLNGLNQFSYGIQGVAFLPLILQTFLEAYKLLCNCLKLCKLPRASIKKAAFVLAVTLTGTGLYANLGASAANRYQDLQRLLKIEEFDVPQIICFPDFTALPVCAIFILVLILCGGVSNSAKAVYDSLPSLSFFSKSAITSDNAVESSPAQEEPTSTSLSNAP